MHAQYDVQPTSTMASSIQDSSLSDSGAVEWSSYEAPLHSNTGSSIHLSGSAHNTATREMSPEYGYGMYGIAFTRDEVAVGQMFKILNRDKDVHGRSSD